jgi:hypothetical protein
MKENNRKERVENLGKLVIRVPTEQEGHKQAASYVSFERLLDRLSSHCIGGYLWVYSA